MTVQEVAKAVMRETNKTQTDVARIAGLTGQGSVGMYLKSKSMRVESLLQILNACGYELVARSGDGRHPEYVIGQSLQASAEWDATAIEEMVRKTVASELAKAGIKPETK